MSVDNGVSGLIAMTSRRQSTTCWYYSAGPLQLFCGVFALMEASVVSGDVSDELATPRLAADAEVANDRCPAVVVDGPGSCRCSPLSEIRCRNLTGVPEFRRDGPRYSVAYLDRQDIASVPAAAFRHLRVARIVLNFNPIGAALSGDALRELETSVLELETSMRELETSVCELETSVCELETSVCELETSVHELETSVRELETSVRELETSVCELETSVHDLELGACRVHN